MMKKDKKKKLLKKNLHNIDIGRETILNASKSKMFLTKSKGLNLWNTDNSKLKILTPKQMFQRLPIALPQVKAGNISENLLNEIRQIVHSFY